MLVVLHNLADSNEISIFKEDSILQDTKNQSDDYNIELVYNDRYERCLRDDLCTTFSNRSI